MTDSTLTQDDRAAPGATRSAAHLYQVLFAEAPLEPSARFRLDDVDVVTLGRADARSVSREEQSGSSVLRLGAPDRWMSTRHAKLTRVMKSWVLEDEKSKNGLKLNGQIIERAELVDGDVFELGRTFYLFRAQQPVTHGAPLELRSDALVPNGLATLQPALAESFSELTRIAKSNVSVALTGQSGSGKEVVARALHRLSGRSGAFIAVNCGALPDELIESELFGHKKGAFSGALDDRPGLVRTAHGGTLLLDEVADLPLEEQPALLRVLQERQVTPVGGTTPLPVDLRVVSATHYSLEALVAEKAFRDDLRARLTGWSLRLPTLHERREDLGLILAQLLQRQSAAGVRFDVAAARALMLYEWPLNVRELEKALEAAAVLAGASSVQLEHLPPQVRAAQGRPQPKASADESARDAELKRALETLLREHQGNVSAVARAMGKARMQIQRWVARFGFDLASFKR